MSQIRLLCDECIGRPLFTVVVEVLKHYETPGEYKHIIDVAGPGVKDDVWIPRLAQEGWTVLTTDGGGKPGPKLHKICKEYKVTHIIISGSLHEKKHFEKARAIFTVWPEIVKACAGERGVRYRLRQGQHYPLLENAAFPQRPI